LASAELAVPPVEQLPPAVVPESRFQSLDSALLYSTFSFLLLGPLAFGAVESWAVWSLSLGAAALFMFWVWRQVTAGFVRVTPNPLFAPMLVFGAILSVQVVFRLSAYPHATESGALLYCAYAVFAFMASQLLRRTAQVKAMAWLMTAYGFGVAVFGIIQSLSSTDKLYWIRTPELGGWIYGPYVSHNHYAGLMEMLFPIALLSALHPSLHRSWKWVPAFAAVLMASTIFLSGSRGGMVAFLVQMLVLGAILAWEKDRRSAWMVFSVLVLITALISWIGGQALASRIGSIRTHPQVDVDTSVRLKIDSDGLRMFAQKPVLGWGLGTFPAAYPHFRSFSTDKFTNHAHNDHLQFLIETGLLGFTTVVWFVVSLYRAALKKVKNWHSDLNGAVALAALSGCTGIVVHSFFDSNLQVPANAALFYVLAAVATANTHFGAHRRVRHHRKNNSQLSVPYLKIPLDGSKPIQANVDPGAAAQSVEAPAAQRC
jgi:O-antigen ligase